MPVEQSMEAFLTIQKVVDDGDVQYMIDVKQTHDKEKELVEENLGIDTSIDDVYLSVKSLQDSKGEQKGYKLGMLTLDLDVGDVVKLGRIKLMVTELMIAGELKGRIQTKYYR